MAHASHSRRRFLKNTAAAGVVMAGSAGAVTTFAADPPARAIAPAAGDNAAFLMVTNLKSRLEAGQSVIGSFVNLRSPDAAELMSRSGFDFLLIDAEHSGIGPENQVEMIRATEQGSATALVKVAESSAAHVQSALDAGAKGILFPRIRSVEDVRHAVSLCRYPPDGIRGLGPGRASGYGAKLLDYATTANQEILVMILIETLEAVESIDEIAAVPGVDLIYIGSGDLSQLLGVTGQLNHPQIREIGQRVMAASRRNKIPVGTIAMDDGTLTYWKDQGVQLLTVGSDAFFLAKSTREWVDRLR